jgi:Carboxypeptidase regulatory-like domain/TonB-dependent Receptor Plug Domain
LKEERKQEEEGVKNGFPRHTFGEGPREPVQRQPGGLAAFAILGCHARAFKETTVAERCGAGWNWKKLLCALGCLLAVAFSASGQQGQLSGFVRDPSGAVIAGATVTIHNVATGSEQTTTTNDAGIYAFPLLPPATYRLMVEARGFQKKIVDNLVLDVTAKANLNVELAISSTNETVTVNGNGLNINTTDASVSTVVDRQFVENIPLNGRSFQPLMTLIPGVSVVPSTSGRTGELTVNGQRTEANYFTVDGVSANTGANPLSAGWSAGYGGALLGTTTLGTTQSLVSIDALQEFRVTTSTYSAEYGRTPGGQFTFSTRSGTNDWHGSAFDYLRNEAFDANNWFNNYYDQPRQAEKQNDFGGTLGGPIRIPHIYNGRDKTYFFFSYEGLRLQQPQAAQPYGVPSTELREQAPAALQPFVNAFPLPDPGSDNGDGMAIFTGGYVSPSHLDTVGIRIDQNVSDKFKIFGRYSDSSSGLISRSSLYTGNLANPAAINGTVRSGTLGATNVLSSRLSNELRFNITQNNSDQKYSVDNFGGATPFDPTSIPGFSSTGWLAFYPFWDMNPYFGFYPVRTDQRQWNITDTASWVVGRHSFKWGIDYRRLSTNSLLPPDYQFGLFSSEDEIIDNQADYIFALRTAGKMEPIYTNFSAFVQDEWKATSRLSLSLGLRWELNPPPHDAYGNNPYTITTTDPATSALAPKGTPLWKTTYGNFAPRIGVAYQIRQTPGHETVLRAGTGLFYDLGNAQASTGYWLGAGISSTTTFPNLSDPTIPAFPLTPDQIANLPVPSTGTPYTSEVIGFDPHLKLPYTWQWNVALQQAFGANQSFTLGYVGAAGRRLLQQKQYDPALLGNTNFVAVADGGNGLYVTKNANSSDYNALQAQFDRRLTHGLQMLLSYTYSHAIDDATTNFEVFTVERASSDNDIRHNFQAAVTYNIPGNYSNRLASAVLKDWSLDTRISARSALPVDIYGVSFASDSLGATVNFHPDRVLGVPLYLHDSTAPGGRVINFAAFTVPFDADGNPIEGDFPRNGARGFDAVQVDLAVQRAFPITERVKLQFRAEAFNLFNHAIFGTIYNDMSYGTPLFGTAYQTQNTSLGGLSSLYQAGGPRSLQLALRLQF